MAIQDPIRYFDKKQYDFLQEFLHHKTRDWLTIESVPLFLRTAPVFDRIEKAGGSVTDLVDIVPSMKIIEKKCGEIIYNDYENVHIVINGRVALRYHEEDPLNFQYLGEYMMGKVLGHPKLDNGVSLMGQVYQVVVSSICVLIKMPIELFDERVWKQTMNTKLIVRANMLNMYKLASQLSQQTLNDILTSHSQIKLFKPG